MSQSIRLHYRRRIAAKLAKTQHIIYFSHGLPCAPNMNRKIWFLRYGIEKILGHFTSSILVMNNYDEDLCKRKRIIRNRNKIFRIPGMGVDLSKFNDKNIKELKNQVFEELSIDESNKLVIFVGRLIKEKGVFDFIDAAVQLCRKRKDVCFLMVGAGPESKKLNRRIDHAELNDRIKLLGWRDDFAKFLKSSDIFVLPSYFPEGRSVAILEAMACGKPVIVSKNRGCEDTIIDNECGYIVLPKNALALAEKIDFLLDNEDVRNHAGSAARKHVEKNYELNYCTKKILQVLERAVE